MIEAENVLIGELGKAVEYVYPETLEKSITANGEYNASEDNTYGYSKVTVDVQPPAPALQSKETTPTTETQTITYDEGYDGLGQVQVNPIPSEYIIPTGTVNITENGTTDVTNYASVSVNVPPTPATPNYVSFYNYQGTALDVSWLNVSNITDMSNMFNTCKKITSTGAISGINSWNTSNVTTMQQMFDNCTYIETIDLSNFDTSNVTSMQYMFRYCTFAKYIYLNNFVAKSGVTIGQMFRNCPSLELLRLDKFDFRNISGSTGNLFDQVPKNCHIYVLDQYAKSFLEDNFAMTNVEIAS